VTYSIGKLAGMFGLSRSTLLYYHSIGLLVPSGRSAANYRRYSERDVSRMKQIAAYREAGLPLATIGEMLSGRKAAMATVLEGRLQQINGEIQGLRDQQQVIVQLLQNHKALRKSRVMTKDRWVAILKATGMDEAARRRWHVEFETAAPEAHQDFLESLGLSRREISGIRRWSRQA
jgi:DNA-binding transcriptional MerR regulator